MRFAAFIHKTLTPQIAPMVYVMMFVSSFIGFCFMTGLIIDDTESILYGSGVLVDRQIWGALLHFSATGALFGFGLNNRPLISFCGIFGFMLWLFAAISLAQEHHWYGLVTLALFHLIFHGYVVLANTLDYLRRVPLGENS